jgi:hypothetical protein
MAVGSMPSTIKTHIFHGMPELTQDFHPQRGGRNSRSFVGLQSAISLDASLLYVYGGSLRDSGPQIAACVLLLEPPSWDIHLALRTVTDLSTGPDYSAEDTVALS